MEKYKTSKGEEKRHRELRGSDGMGMGTGIGMGMGTGMGMSISCLLAINIDC